MRILVYFQKLFNGTERSREMSIEGPAIVVILNNGPQSLTNTILLLHRLRWRLCGLVSRGTSNSNATMKTLISTSESEFIFFVRKEIRNNIRDFPGNMWVENLFFLQCVPKLWKICENRDLRLIVPDYLE